MSVVLGTLCLNEMEFLPALYEQHCRWPGLERWVWVEAADRAYADVNPSLVSRAGLSTDGTTEFLADLARRDPRVLHVRHGFADHRHRDMGKVGARQRYLDVANELAPRYVIALDADEFYTKDDQGRLVEVMDAHPSFDAFTFLRREIWWPPSLAHEPRFSCEVVGGFWGIPCAHWWRWKPAMRHGACHNAPEGPDGVPFNERLARLHETPDGLPQMIHLGFAATPRTRLAKNRYYHHRGEARDHKRKWYVESRAAWENWQPGGELPRGAKVIPYTGPVPEVFR